MESYHVAKVSGQKTIAMRGCHLNLWEPVDFFAVRERRMIIGTGSFK